ncbi:hypothetical protein FHW58_001331 [Duganella sp. 1224]|uniref:hypothetical protein n=1 Tax=Duganella sp. 1224 TaxID=2587052 RepID=UPI0015CE7B25|nr:hypothetical protein [Duganella sp. 1224]NYE60179.1 hypothetical protein [Duganella sp. 1224]
MRWLLLPLLLAGLLSGCGINHARPVSYTEVIGNHRAMVIYGVKLEGVWRYPRFSLLLEEFDANTGKITGNCWVRTHTQATVDSTPGEVRYFAFDVPPGQYVYSPFNAKWLNGGTLAFEAPAGKRTYVGDFVFEKNGTVSLRQDLAAAGASVGWPLSVADTRVVNTPFIFMCTM